MDYDPVALAATGGVSPYSWSISAGTLPGGLTLGGDGNIAGTPTSAGTFRFTVQVADSAGGTAGLPGKIGIAAAPSATLIAACANYCSVEVGCVNVCGRFGTLSGGTAPFTYISAGPVPAGVHLNGLSLAGTFTQRAQYWRFRVTVIDAFGQTTSISPTFLVFPHITLASGTCIAWQACTVTLRYSVGIPQTPTMNAVWTGDKTCGAAAPTTCPPPPFKATVQGGLVTIVLGPTSWPNNPAGTFRLTLYDQNLCGAGVYCSAGATLTVNLNYG